MPYFVIAVLVLALLIMAFVNYSTRRQIKNITEKIKKIGKEASNQTIRVESPAPIMVDLANAVNVQYDEIQQERQYFNRTMGEMRQNMADISHDLRTPLTSILGYLQLLQKSTALAGKEKEYLEIAYEKSLFLHSMVDGLFELARLEAGAVPLEFEKINAGNIVAEELASQYEAFLQAGKEPQVQLAEQPLWIIADRQAVKRIYANLLENMLCYSEGEMRITTNKQDEQVCVCFSNQCSSLRPEDVDNLFQRFYKADKSRTRKSTGLGLAIVKEFTNQTGGTIEAQYQDGWLTFVLCWPAA